ncbi:hypothetical protein [Dyella sedimenti]|uniref:hypothetical protein n=1 Tax=Dyella sedimenti TaxID=2919947 RepID=UPI001FA9AFBF|nr:hypothetical protein [Dyella sedimenti]
MSAILKVGAPVLFMKIGIHAREPLDEIIQRKLQEIDTAGVAFWGYGGSTCHPNRVQSFAADHERIGNPIHLVMQKMDSNHWAEPLPADQYSIDGRNWVDVPRGIEVRGSRYALVVEDLHADSFRLPLARTEVAIGENAGRLGSDYIAGRVDKACLQLTEGIDIPLASDEEAVEIGLVARLKAPYSVFLRNS